MKVTFRWTEQVQYTSTIDVPDAQYQAWADREFSTDMYDDQFAPGIVRDYLQETLEDWVSEVHRDNDFEHVEDREVQNVTEVKREENA